MAAVTQDPYLTRLSSIDSLASTIVDRPDPVVWGSNKHDGPLTPEQVAAFEQDGVLQLSEAIPAGSFEELQALAARLRAGEGLESVDPSTVVRELGDERKIRSVFAVHRQLPLLQELLDPQRESFLVRMARQILGSDVYVHQSRINFKPGMSSGFYWHSDFETWHAEDGMPRPRAFSVSIALTDNVPHNGPLMVMPGSHRRFVRCIGETPVAHHLQSLRKQEIGTPTAEQLEALYADHGIRTLTGKASAATVFDCNTMHGSAENISPEPRSNLFFVFNSVENCLTDPFYAKAQRPEHIAHRQ